MFKDELDKLRHAGLLRLVKDREPCSTSGRIKINGAEYLNFASNDYLGLAGHVSLSEAAKKAMEAYGFGSGASRLLSGGTRLHAELERAVAAFKGAGSALILNSGYTANISAIPAIAGKGDIILSDELNHASIIDGCRLSRAKTSVFRHRDMEHLSDLLKKEKGNKKVIVTDTVFSMDGDLAPLPEIHDLCLAHNALLYIDDAHGTGVLGDGKGALTHFCIKPEPWIIQMGTFSKALGAYGAFVAASKDVIDWLINTGRGFIYSTALPASCIAASIAALQLLQKDPSRVERLWQNRGRLVKGIHDLGFDTMDSVTPIVPVVVGDVEKTSLFSEVLMRHHIYAPAIRPPTVTIPRIRITVTASHTAEDLDRLLGALKKAVLEIL